MSPKIACHVKQERVAHKRGEAVEGEEGNKRCHREASDQLLRAANRANLGEMPLSPDAIMNLMRRAERRSACVCVCVFARIANPHHPPNTQKDSKLFWNCVTGVYMT